MPRFFVCFASQKAASAQRNGPRQTAQRDVQPTASRCKRLLPQAFCRHSIQHEGAPAPSYSPCETEHLFSKQRFFDKLNAVRRSRTAFLAVLRGISIMSCSIVNRRAAPGQTNPHKKKNPRPHRRGSVAHRSLDVQMSSVKIRSSTSSSKIFFISMSLYLLSFEYQCSITDFFTKCKPFINILSKDASILTNFSVRLGKLPGTD